VASPAAGQAPQPTPTPPTVHDVVVVGAGPAGLGVAAALQRIGVHARVVDRHGIGASFRRWPTTTRLLTPSFTGNQFGLVDLNAVTPDTSPALSLVEEHPSGEQYARYLEMVAELEQLDVTIGVHVTDVRPATPQERATAADGRVGDGQLLVVTAEGAAPLLARAVVWAAGEFGYPRLGELQGSEHCRHTATVPDLTELEGDRLVVIGGYESGIDTAVALVDDGRDVTVLDREAPWATIDPDPSRSLSPYTHGRLRTAHATGRLELLGDAEVLDVVDLGGSYAVRTADGGAYKSDGPPLLATGFAGSLTLVRDRFAFDDRGRVVLDEETDGSTVLPGLYLAGPMLAHREAIFCFIYKFRQRFGVVARAIGEQLGHDTAPLEALREHGFLLDDLSCCDDCAC
jgi:putative flavoprotein involved in K+ transport